MIASPEQIRAAFNNLVKNHLIQEEFSEYNKRREDCFASTALKLLMKESAADLKHVIDNPDNETKPAYILGNAAHCMVLEGLRPYKERFVIGGPKNDKGEEYGMGSQKFADKREIINSHGRELITNETNTTAMAMRKSCLKHPIVKDILSEGVAEMVLRIEFYGVLCQVRFDWLSPTWGIPDLKTCRDLKQFQREARYKYGYLYQAGFYQGMAYMAAPEFGFMPFCFIAVESKPPYKVGVFEVTADDLEYFRNGVADAILYFKRCRDGDDWPTGFEDLQTI